MPAGCTAATDGDANAQLKGGGKLHVIEMVIRSPKKRTDLMDR